MLEEHFLKVLSELGSVRWRRMFGWTCAQIGRNFFGGYQVLDDNVIILFLVLSPKGYKKATSSGLFEKFDFGQTWAQVELNREEHIAQIHPYLKDAVEYLKIRRSKKTKKK